MRRYITTALVVILVGGASILIPGVRREVRALVRREPPAPITPLAVLLPPTIPAVTETPEPATPVPTTTATEEPHSTTLAVRQTRRTPTPSRTARPRPSATPTAVVVN